MMHAENNKQFRAGPKRLRHEECQVIGLEKKQKSEDAKELGLDPVNDSQPELKCLYFFSRIEKDI